MNAFQCQVHGRDLGRAMAAFEGAGFVIDRAATFPVGNGMYTLIVYAPAGMNAAGLDFRQLEQGNRQRSRRWRTIRKTLTAVAILAIVGVVGYYGLQFAGDAAAGIGDVPAKITSAWDAAWATFNGEEAPAKVAPKPTPTPKPPEFFGVQLPDFFGSSGKEADNGGKESSIFDPVTKPLEDAKNAAIMAFNVFLGLCVLVVLFMARGVIGALFGGIASVAGMFKERGKP